MSLNYNSNNKKDTWYWRISLTGFFVFLTLLIVLCLGSKSPSTQMKQAIERHDLQAVGRLLDEGIDPNISIMDAMSENQFKIFLNRLTGCYNSDHFKFEEKVSSLAFAVHLNDKAIVQLLLDRGSSPNPSEHFFRTPPLAMAVMNDDLKMAEILILAKADLRCGDGKGGLVWRANINGDRKLVRLLKQHGALD